MISWHAISAQAITADRPGPAWPASSRGGVPNPSSRRVGVAVVDSDGDVTLTKPERSLADWLGLSDPWPVGEPFPKA
ncbi:hypothetical protein AB0M43_07525 [Longispora sp. NPDC051575]|uniref:hypothetical protein n=1 Tax=Longispora sp. NPDC051575 TaxID=3154943 RepID=UPI00341C6BE9